MRIGAALVLIAIGAILRFAITTVSTHGINLHTIGNILMLVGVLGVILWLVMWAPWTRRRRSVYAKPPVNEPVDEEHHVYRSGDRPYRAYEEYQDRPMR